MPNKGQKMKRKIITVNDGDEGKILHILAQCVSDEKEARNILKDLVDSLPENGAGLMACQIGYNKRVFIVRDGKKIIPFVNPKLVLSPKNLETEIDSEGCLSIPGKMFLIARYKRIEVLDEGGQRYFEGQLARVVQHEFSHAAGVTIDQIGKEIEQ